MHGMKRWPPWATDYRRAGSVAAAATGGCSVAVLEMQATVDDAIRRGCWMGHLVVDRVRAPGA